MTTFPIGKTILVDLPSGRHVARVVGREDGTLNYHLPNEWHYIVRVGDQWRAVPESACYHLQRMEHRHESNGRH